VRVSSPHTTTNSSCVSRKRDASSAARRTHTTHCVCALEHGFHNVSRWMTWLPISLKNAAKCDKWYQLQNHSITESLNANGAREKSSPDHPRACRISQCRTKTQSFQKSLGLCGRRVCVLHTHTRSFARPSGCPPIPRNTCFRFMGINHPFGSKQKHNHRCAFSLLDYYTLTLLLQT